MDKLCAARVEIDQIDREMARLFARRMTAVEEVASYKKEHGLAVLDAAREEEVVAKNKTLLPREAVAFADLYEDFLRHNMALSRAWQQRILGRDAVAYQGVQGAFSHIALTRLFPYARAVAQPTWDGVVDAVERGEAAYGVLPFENSHAGDVSEVLDLCFAHEAICVSAMYDLPISQNLLGLSGASLADVKTVVSHPQALSQSAKFIRSLGLAAESCPNTAMAAQRVAESGDQTLAAIAARETADLYGLSVLASDVNESADNTTRFICIGRELPKSGNRFSVLFTVAHEAGSLARVIEAIGGLGYNMECIKSRPMPHRRWEYYFYTEMVGSPSDALLNAMHGVCRTVRILGVYAR